MAVLPELVVAPPETTIYEAHTGEAPVSCRRARTLIWRWGGPSLRSLLASPSLRSPRTARRSHR